MDSTSDSKFEKLNFEKKVYKLEETASTPTDSNVWFLFLYNSLVWLVQLLEDKLVLHRVRTVRVRIVVALSATGHCNEFIILDLIGMINSIIHAYLDIVFHILFKD